MALQQPGNTETDMLYVHPVLMLCFILLTLYCLRLGWIRFAARHMGSRAVFPWKRHVLLGRLALAGLSAGMCGGLSMTWFIWNDPFSTGMHAAVAGVILVLAVFGAATGQRLNALHGTNKALALAHGIGNALLSALALGQVYTGYRVLKDIIW